MSNTQLEFVGHREQGESDSLPLSSLDCTLQSTLNSLCLEHRRIGVEIDERVKTQKSLKESIEELILTLPTKRIQAPGWRTVKSQKITHPLQRHLLIKECNARDIDPITVIEIIVLASPEKKGKEYVSILAPSEEQSTSTAAATPFD